MNTQLVAPADSFAIQNNRERNYLSFVSAVNSARRARTLVVRRWRQRAGTSRRGLWYYLWVSFPQWSPSFSLVCFVFVCLFARSIWKHRREREFRVYVRCRWRGGGMDYGMVLTARPGGLVVMSGLAHSQFQYLSRLLPCAAG